MAEIKKIIPNAPLSNFRQAAPDAGGAFRFLAGAMEEGYKFLAPAAEKEMKAHGEALGNEIARQQIGNPSAEITASSMGADGFNASLARTESGGNYQAQNSEGYVGKYQWGAARLADFNKANGTSITMEQFKASGPIQEQAQKWHIANVDKSVGDLVGRVVNGVTMTKNALRAMAHLGGIGGARKFVESGGSYNPQDSNGTSLLDYAVTHGGTETTASSSSGPYAPPTMLRDADGKLTARLYSPLAGPLLQVSNAAAGVAYQSDVMLKGMTDMMDMSNQFALNPDGFRQAAASYVDDLVKAAPDMFKGDIRAGIEKVVEQRFLGMVEERQSDIRQRAANSSSALADRWSDTLAQAVATGNPDAIASAQAELSSVLRARETLPGLSWTAEQSQNMIIKAHQEGERIAEKAKTDRGNKMKADLGLISSAAQAGRTSDTEALLQDPEAQALFPDQWREAAASVMLRDEMPSFMKMTPAEQQQALADMKAQPVSADWEMDLYGVAEKAATANAAAWEADPIKHAGEVLTEKPPVLPTIEEAMSQPGSITEALAARVAYAENLKAKGYVDFTSVFTDDEAKTYGALFGKETPPEVKAALAGAVVAGAGKDAMRVFKELKSDDPVTLRAGMLMARTGDTVVPVMAMKGQAMLDQGIVQPPQKATTVGSVSPTIASALSVLPNAEAVMGDTLKLATAIYAYSSSPNATDATSEKERMDNALQLALGQSTNKRGELTGGVQTVGAGSVLLPAGMSGEKLNSALETAFSGMKQSTGLTVGMDGFAPTISLNLGASQSPDAAKIWTDAGAGSAPMLGGEPLKAEHFKRAVLTPLGGNMYSLSLSVNGQMVDVGTATGAPFIFDAAKLISASKGGVASATSPLAHPGQSDGPVQAAISQYPILRDLGLQVKTSIGASNSMLEFWPPGETGDSAYPRPSSLSSNNPGIEIYSGDVRPIDVLGDVVSHYLVNTDKKIAGYYQKFQKSLTADQNVILQEQYKYAVKNNGETRPYDEWLKISGMPAYFRGYAFDQWKNTSDLYTKEQISMFDDMMGYLKSDRIGAKK